MKIIKGETVEEQINYIDRFLSHIKRRLHKQSSVIIPPYPISNCIYGEDVSGDILKYMFPADGEITKGLVCISSNKSVDIDVKISIENETGGSSKSFLMSKKQLKIEPNLEILSGDKLTISIEPQEKKEEDKISEVWISFLWVPTVKDSKVKNFLIDELEKSSNELIGE